MTIGNIPGTQGNGTVKFNVDIDNSGVSTPVSKLAFGVSGSVVLVDAVTNNLPVIDASVVTAVGTVATSLGSDGSSPPTLPGGSTGVRGWLRYIASLIPALVGGRLPVDGSGVTQPVSLVSQPLPTGASTSAAQTTGNASLASVDSKLPALVGGKIPVDTSGTTQPVSISSLPLPAGAATAAAQTTAQTTLGSIDTKVTGLATAAAQTTAQTSLSSIDSKFTGISTVAAQATGNASLASIDTKLTGNALDTTVAGVTTSLGTDGSSAPTLPGGSTGVRGWLRYIASLFPALVSGRFPVDGSAVTQPVSATALPLPTGAATNAAQTTAQTSLSSIDTKLSGLATAAAQTNAQTSLSSIDGKLTGIATASQQTTAQTSLSSIDSKLSGISTATQQTTAQTSLSSIDTKLTGNATDASVAAITTSLGADGTGGPTLPTGSSGVRGWLRYIASLFPTLVSGRFPVDGSGVTQPVSATALPLPTGAATSAAQTTAQTSLSSIDTKTPSLGQALAAASVPSVLPALQISALAQAADLGAQVDGAATTDTGTFSLIALVKRLLTKLVAPASTVNRLANFTGASSATLAASNANRKCLVIFVAPGSTGTLYVDTAGGTASATVATLALIANGAAELESRKYGTGLVTAIFIGGSGTAYVTEMT